MAQTICKTCILDTTSKLISFDAEGVCNYCRKFERDAKDVLHVSAQVKEERLRGEIEKIKALGKGKKYDCILGLSGGVDSSYLALLAKEQGLRPLVVHFDNGWNTETAVKNIEQVVKTLGFDLHTHVIDWEMFRDAQKAYIKASVLDMEVPTDMLIFAVLFDLAKKFKIKTILSGYNIATEGVLPRDWSYVRKFDAVNFRGIIKKHGNAKTLSRFPYLGFYRYHIYKNYYQINLVPLLNHINYKKHEVKARLANELNWVDYGGKHNESVWTRFYQGYILPKKFNIDKRKAHLSNLILNGEITREQALAEMQQEPYSPALQAADKAYVCKKFGFSTEEFDALMALEEVPHEVYGQETDYPLTMKLFEKISLFILFQFFYRFRLLPNTHS